MTARLDLFTMADVAARLGKSVRWLQEHLRTYPCGRLAGRTRLFTDSDIGKLIESLPKDRGKPCRSRSSRRAKVARNSIGSEEPTSGSTWTELQKHLTGPRRDASSRRGKSASNVVSFQAGRS